MKTGWRPILLLFLALLLASPFSACAESYTQEDLDVARQVGYADGLDVGYREGKAEGYTEGYNLRLAELELAELEIAKQYEKGYQAGYNDAGLANIAKALVTRVIDGDTIEVDIAGGLHTVRYIGIDTPEVGQSCADEATDKNCELVEGKIVWLEKDVSEIDKYDRLLRYVHVGNVFVNADLVRLGLAEAKNYPPDDKYEDYFAFLQSKAQENEIGIWKPKKVRPLIQPTAKYVGSINSNVYHYPSCRYVERINPQNKIWFSSVEDAKAHGYRPCKVCKPPG